MSRTIVLTGAPQTTSLDWTEKNLLPTLPLKGVDATTDLPPISGSTTQKSFTAQWRQLAFNEIMRPSLPKLDILSPLQGVDNGPANFFNVNEFLSQDLAQESARSDISAEESRPSQDSTEIESEALSEFYDQSFAIHEAVPSSQLESSGNSGYTPGTPTYDSSDDCFSSGVTIHHGIIRTPSQRRLSQAPRPKHLSDLEDIPNSSYIKSIHPQTMTLNLIVSVLSIAPARRIKTNSYFNRAPREVDLVELTVGDETKSGFNISMWLPREMHVNWKDGAQAQPEGSRSMLRRNLRTLRPRDIILLQNVALSSFRGKVHGQSLRGDVTKVDLLYRKKRNDEEVQGVYSVQNLRMATGKDSQVMKVRRVRDWIVEFVGEETKEERGKKGRRGVSFLPDDTE